jgi:hypothetical protein
VWHKYLPELNKALKEQNKESGTSQGEPEKKDEL